MPDVSVLVNVDARSELSVVQALEAALAEAKVRAGLAAGAPAPPARSSPSAGAKTRVAPKTGPHATEASSPTNKGKSTEPSANTEDGESQISALREKLTALAETAVLQKAVCASWTKKPYRSWLQRLRSVHGRPSNFAPLLLELEKTISVRCPLRGWKSRRPAWRNECSTAKTYHDVARLIAELSARLKLDGRIPGDSER